jgi:hypothetical protein
MRLFNVIFSFLFLVSSFTYAQETYTVGSTEYYYNDYYSTTGKPKVKRSYANKMEFLRSQGFNSVPEGYEVDHIIPLSQGGSDSPYNMQLLTVEQHKIKTAKERANTSSYSGSASSYSLPSFSSSSSSLPPVPKFSVDIKSSTSYDVYNFNSSSSGSYSLPSSSVSNSRVYHTGPRGGTYYINSNGNKTYVKK